MSTGLDRFRNLERRFAALLMAGFALVLIMMAASGWMGWSAMSQIDREADAVSQRYVQETQWIDELAQQESRIGALLYSMATQTERQDLRARLEVEREKTRNLVEEAWRGAPDAAERAAWKAIGEAAGPLFAEAIALGRQGRHNSPALNEAYGRFTIAAGHLLDAAYTEAARSRAAQLTWDEDVLRSARNLFLLALALAAVCAGVSVAGSMAAFHRLKKDAATLADWSLHTLAEHEENARRFSQDLHDEFGQVLNAIESNLTVVKPVDATSGERVQDSITLVKGAQSMAREMSQLLRPQILDDFGLDAGLRELARGFSQRTGIVVEYQSQLRERMSPQMETHVFRIAQEALTNVSRHSIASSVTMAVERLERRLVLAISDNGQGFATDGPASGGLGLLGMRERVRAIGGTLAIHSRPERGVAIRVEAPLAEPGA
ncbi:MAG: histidine kinase [Verrucomicrobiota bacterium]